MQNVKKGQKNISLNGFYAQCNRRLSHFASHLFNSVVQASIALSFPWVTLSFSFLFLQKLLCIWLSVDMQCIAIGILASRLLHGLKFVDILYYCDSNSFCSQKNLIVLSSFSIFFSLSVRIICRSNSEHLLSFWNSFVLDFGHGATETTNKSVWLYGLTLNHHNDRTWTGIVIESDSEFRFI